MKVDGGSVLKQGVLLIHRLHDFVMTVSHTHCDNTGKALHCDVIFGITDLP